MRYPIRKAYPIECIFDFSPGNIVIPLDWTPKQAEKIASILQLIDEKIWSIYADLIIAKYKEDCLIDEHERLEAQEVSLYDRFDEDIPF